MKRFVLLLTSSIAFPAQGLADTLSATRGQRLEREEHLLNLP